MNNGMDGGYVADDAGLDPGAEIKRVFSEDDRAVHYFRLTIDRAVYDKEPEEFLRALDAGLDDTVRAFRKNIIAGYAAWRAEK